MLEEKGEEEIKKSIAKLMYNRELLNIYLGNSSIPVLNPLFEIAKKHRTQLICLSDLKQNSILKVRASAIGSNEYLEFEEIIRDDSNIQNDEKLEKAIFRVSEHKQINLFE